LLVQRAKVLSPPRQNYAALLEFLSMLYSLLRPFLFRLEPETAHHLTLMALRTVERLGWRGEMRANGCAPIRAMGIDFPNPVGLAAGLDKNGEYLEALAGLGFGFIEVGTVTPRPQPGNPRPRLFRLPQARALINRMGFNNAGVDVLAENIARSRYRGVLGISIGKNADTRIERAAEDYVFCMSKIYSLASYVVVNISSPNTRGLRQLQGGRELDSLLAQLKSEQRRLAALHAKQVPLLVKIAPDLDSADIAEIAELLLAHEINGVIATNTTVSRQSVDHLPHGAEAGGLSGAPLRARSSAVIRQLAESLKGRVAIIGVGGIMSAADAKAKLAAGASLVQLYTGLIYQGPGLPREIVGGLGKPVA
jgi:dihydroorotate dehydrogenase